MEMLAGDGSGGFAEPSAALSATDPAMPMPEPIGVCVLRCVFVAVRAMSSPSVLVHHSSLARRILHVLLVGSDEEMGGVDTGRVVPSWAIVANLKAFRNRSDQQYPGQPVRPDQPPVFGEGGAVSVVGLARPQPTRIGANGPVDLCPEPIRERAVQVVRPASRTAMPTVVANRDLGPDRELFAAPLANAMVALRLIGHRILTSITGRMRVQPAGALARPGFLLTKLYSFTRACEREGEAVGYAK